MAKAPGFSTHHKSAKEAFASGDHGKAMHHIGHMMRAVRTAMKPQGMIPPSAGSMAVSPSAGLHQSSGEDTPSQASEVAIPEKRGLGNWLASPVKQPKTNNAGSPPPSQPTGKRARLASTFASLRGKA